MKLKTLASAVLWLSVVSVGATASDSDNVEVNKVITLDDFNVEVPTIEDVSNWTSIHGHLLTINNVAKTIQQIEESKTRIAQEKQKQKEISSEESTVIDTLASTYGGAGIKVSKNQMENEDLSTKGWYALRTFGTVDNPEAILWRNVIEYQVKRGTQLQDGITIVDIQVDKVILTNGKETFTAPLSSRRELKVVKKAPTNNMIGVPMGTRNPGSNVHQNTSRFQTPGKTPRRAKLGG